MTARILFTAVLTAFGIYWIGAFITLDPDWVVEMTWKQRSALVGIWIIVSSMVTLILCASEEGFDD